LDQGLQIQDAPVMHPELLFCWFLLCVGLSCFVF